jgi:hypothetical protein
VRLAGRACEKTTEAEEASGSAWALIGKGTWAWRKQPLRPWRGRHSLQPGRGWRWRGDEVGVGGDEKSFWLA